MSKNATVLALLVLVLFGRTAGLEAQSNAPPQPKPSIDTSLAATEALPQASVFQGAPSLTLPRSTDRLQTVEGAQVLSVARNTVRTTPVFHASYQWQRCAVAGLPCADIWDASGPEYVPSAVDIGLTVRSIVKVFVRQRTGSLGWAMDTSEVVSVIAPRQPPALVDGALPRLVSEVKAPSSTDEAVLTPRVPMRVASGRWTGALAFSYRVQRCVQADVNCVDGGGDVTSGFVDAEGPYLRVVVTASNPAGSSSATSPSVLVGRNTASGPPPPPTGGNAPILYYGIEHRVPTKSAPSVVAGFPVYVSHDPWPHVESYRITWWTCSAGGPVSQIASDQSSYTPPLAWAGKAAIAARIEGRNSRDSAVKFSACVPVVPRLPEK